MMLKNLTNNAKNLAANAKIEDMTQLFKSTVGKQDVKHALSGVMDISKEVTFPLHKILKIRKMTCDPIFTTSSEPLTTEHNNEQISVFMCKKS